MVTRHHIWGSNAISGTRLDAALLGAGRLLGCEAQNLIEGNGSTLAFPPFLLTPPARVELHRVFGLKVDFNLDAILPTAVWTAHEKASLSPEP
jgi:hypothetical protein